MSTESAQPAQNTLQASTQAASTTHPANRGSDGALRVPISEMAKAAFSQKAEAPKTETKKPDAVAEVKTEAKVETKTDTAKPKTSLFDRKAPEQKTETKAEAKTEADPTGPEDSINYETADPAKKSQFTELKSITKQLRRELAQKEADYKNQIETFKKASPAEAADIQTLKDQLKQAHDRLAILDLQAHPDFAKQYVEPKNKAIAEAKMLLTDNGAGEADVASLLALPRPEFAKKVSELAAKMQDFDKASFTNAMREAYRLHGDSAQALTKASELAAQLQQKSALQQKQAFEETWTKLGEPGEFLITLDVPEGASAEEKAEIAAYNESVGKVRETAERYAFGKMDERQAASLASKAATLDFIIQRGLPRMEKEYTALRTLNEQLAAELKALKGAKETGAVAGDHKGGEPKKADVQSLIAQAYGKR